MDKRPRSSERSEDGEDRKLEIGRHRFVEVSKFKGKTYVNIREYYVDDGGVLKPGRKGIALKVSEWEQLCSFKDRVDQLITEEDRK